LPLLSLVGEFRNGVVRIASRVLSARCCAPRTFPVGSWESVAEAQETEVERVQSFGFHRNNALTTATIKGPVHGK
jgi:hypothetical protein